MGQEAIVQTIWDRQGGTPYQTRVKCGPFRIHIFWRGDRDPDMHDHPADFWTFPLVSYVEEVSETVTVAGKIVGHTWRRRVVRAFRPHRRRAEYAHRVVGAWTGFGKDHDARPIVTLGWWGKKRREWGFHTPDGWVAWRAYVKEPGWDQP